MDRVVERMGRVLWSRREGTLVEWLEDSAGFGIGEEVLVRMKTTIEDQMRHGALFE